MFRRHLDQQQPRPHLQEIKSKKKVTLIISFSSIISFIPNSKNFGAPLFTALYTLSKNEFQHFRENQENANTPHLAVTVNDFLISFRNYCD